ncbi:MAG: 1-acyl-sn-glycerol-3-phosphate acyltransferase [Planctomycetales bacterium]|nr:1-acyl-sn-glycerol-3-phosphate acyltransferase [Planctomycetales bacterium]
MQDIIIEKPYKFVPPSNGTFWSSLFQRFNVHGWWLRRTEGVVSSEVRHVERLKASLQAGHSVMMTPNHCRTADPLAMGWVTKEAGCHVYAMASWHLFNQDWFSRWAIPKVGGFSVNREGVDRQAINLAIDVLSAAERPLVIFPEGAVTRTNDRLHALLDGVAFIARTAAKRRAKRDGGKVVIHPVAIKYLFGGDIKQHADEVLSEIEQRFSWRPRRQCSIDDRVAKVGKALLCLKELEYFGETQQGDLATRMQRLIDRLLNPLEQRWLGGARGGDVVPRVKNLRIQIMPDMILGKITPEEREQRWDDLADIYLAQQISCYPPDYLVERPSVDRYLETIERFEEDLTDKARLHGHLHCILDVGEPIEVSSHRDRKAEVDPVMSELEQRLQGMLDQLGAESPLLDEVAAQAASPS